MKGHVSRVVWAGIVLGFVAIAVAAPVRIIQAHTRSHGFTVTMVRLSFSPGALTVPRGAEVVFQNADVAPHTVTANDGSFDSGTLDPGKAFRLVLHTSITYHCEVHPGMTGQVHVS